MHRLVVGAESLLGRTVIPRLLANGHNVRTVVRHRAQAQFLRQLGLDAIVGNSLDRESLHQAVRGSQAAFYTGREEWWQALAT